VSPRTFNNYFASKGEAIAARHVDRITDVADLVRERPRDEPIWTAITAAVLSQEGLDADPPEGWLEGVRVMVETPALQGEIAKAYSTAGRKLAEVVAERTGTDPDRDLYPKLVAQMIGVAYDVATTQWMSPTDRPRPLGELLRDALEQVAAGLPEPRP
jgi:AcrR family transcriptional regulator